jgi:hypothetical protein
MRGPPIKGPGARFVSSQAAIAFDIGAHVVRPAPL